MHGVGFLNRTAFNIGTLLVSVFCLIYEVIRGHTGKTRYRIFMMALASLIIAALCRTVEAFYAGISIRTRASWLIYCSSIYLFYVIHNFLGLLTCYYALFASQNFRRVPYPVLYASLAPFAISELVLLINPLTGWAYRIETGGGYHLRWGIYLMYITGVIYVAAAMYLFLRRWHGLTRRRKVILIYALTVPIVCIIVQYLYPQARLELLSEAIAFIGVMLAIEYDVELSDTPTGLANRDAFIHDVMGLFGQSRPFSLISVRAVNLETTCRIAHIDPAEVASEAAKYLKQLHPDYLLYHLKQDSFALLILKKSDEAKLKTLLDIQERFGNGFRYEGKVLPIRSLILTAEYPGKLTGIENVLVMCEGNLMLKARTGGFVTEKELDRVFSRASIDKAIHMGIKEHKFLIRYQPVFTPDGRIDNTAEALIRHADLNFSGFQPEDIVRMSEYNGTILELGDYVLNEVCTFLESGVPGKCGISRISINLSAIQCISPDFVRRVEEIVRNYPHVHPSMLCFEIAEAESVHDFRLLSSVVDELRAKGYTLTMEGYGSGYSNMYSVFMMNFDTVKMDRSLLWEAEKNEGGRILLSNSIKMVHEMKRLVTIAGIENEAQYQLAKELEADSLQGFYFSKPLTGEQLSELYSI